MKLFKFTGIILFSTLLFSCGPKLPDSYHMDKKYWDTEDYDAAIRYIKYRSAKEEGYPRLSDPLTAPVFDMLVNTDNVSVVLEDEQLGSKYKSEVAQDFFDVTKDLIKIYQDLDIQDKFVYPLELVGAIKFGLHTQLLYFKVGNGVIIKNAVNPEANDVKKVLKRNEQIVANNFKIYIEFLTKEDAFNDEALDQYATMLMEYYSRLIDEFPRANYSSLKSTATLMSNKVNSVEIKDALEYIIQKIDNK